MVAFHSKRSDLVEPRRLLVVCAHHDDLCDRSRLKLPAEAQLAVIAHAEHSFRRGLQELGRTVAAWVGAGPERPDLPLAPDARDGAEGEPFRELELPESAGPALELDET